MQWAEDYDHFAATFGPPQPPAWLADMSKFVHPNADARGGVRHMSHRLAPRKQCMRNVSIFEKKERCLQDLNLRGETPLDFKSNALTTRPKQLVWRKNYCGIYNQDKILENHKESDFQQFECNYRINFNQIVTSKLIIFPVSNFQISKFS